MQGPQGPIGFREVVLDANQKQQWTNTKAMLLWRAPGFAHIFLSMLSKSQDDMVPYWSDDVPTLATDGDRIIANPKYFFALTLKQRTFALGHEIIHAVLDHCGTGHRLNIAGTISVGIGKTLPYESDVGNRAMDYIVNDMCVTARIGEIKQGWLHDTKIADKSSQWAEVYAKLYKTRKNPPPPGSQFDQHGQPGSASGQTPQAAQQNRQQRQQVWKNAIAQAAAITKENSQRGDGTADQLKFFEQFLEPTVSWVDEITGTFAKKVGAGSWDYRRFDRRLVVRGIFAPGQSGYGCRRLCVFMDSSGSIYGVPHLIDRFMAELAGLFADLKPHEIIVIWCDSRIKRVDRVQDEMDLNEVRHKGAAGGGGTSFIPPFQWVEKEGLDDIDAAVYLTDGDGDFPNEEPPYPVIWCDISGQKEKYPAWGDYIRIPNDGTA